MDPLTGSTVLYTLAAVGLLGLGLWGLLRHGHPLRQIIAINLIGNGVFLLFVARSAASPAMGVDPVPQALVLTGLVIAVAATALALVLAKAARGPKEPS